MSSKRLRPPSMEAEPVSFIPIDRRGGYQNAIDTLRHADMEDGETPRTRLEMKLCELGGAIRDRKQWWIKIYDDEIVAKWLHEIKIEDHPKFDFAIKECRYWAETYKGPARPAAVDGVFSIDDVSTDLLSRLLKGISQIQSEEPRDVHPGSNGIVIDIIHPSMYAYEQGVTPILGGANVYKMPPWKEFVATRKARPEKKTESVDEVMCSKSGLAWLPSEFYITNGKCEINSYINSLHPVKYKTMYDAIADAFIVCAPLLEQVFGELGIEGETFERPLRITDGLRRGSDASYHSESDSDAGYWERRGIIEPKIPESFPVPELNPTLSLEEKNLQVIVKIATIELTPEKPAYPGGSWHIEGMRNERIVATACMYLESNNVTESMLDFRVAVCEPVDYEQNDWRGVDQVYGLKDEQPLVQPRGACRTLQGRVLAWPNTMQHRVRPFKLEDPTRPGKRTILCFFLVDPTLRVRSTATVPPQSREWLCEGMENVLPKQLPQEISTHIAKHLYGLTYEDACERRERLMNERKQIVQSKSEWGGVFFERPFSLCEH